MISISAVLAALVASFHFTTAITLDVNNVDSIRNAACTLAFGLQSNYHNNASGTPATAIGTLPAPLYWWEAGAVWGGMVDYWAYTGDTSYNAVLTQALLAQVGPDWNYEPPAYYTSLGNDDQAFWAFAVLSAEEYGLPFPSGQKVNSWLALAEAVWSRQMSRWNTQFCSGGLKWQIFESNKGYNYRNSISNGAFLQISARLARFTGDQKYVQWADKTWDWMSRIGLISTKYQVFDGTDDTINCTEINHTQWTYNPAVLLYAASMMANYTNTQVWRDRTEGLLTTIENSFFSPYSNATDVMYEPACEPINTCNNDQFSFKAYLSRWMAKSAVIYPSITDNVRKRLQASALAAAKSCTGGDNKQTCGVKWYVGGYDGSYGVGQELSAMETVQGLLLLEPGAAKNRVPKTGSNVMIQVNPATSTFPLTPTTSLTSSPGSSGHSGTNSGGRTSSITASSENGGLRSWMAVVTPVVLVMAFGLTR